jgi:UDP-2-acetamido-2-deoxy-ribo-hexuluronate aminotransferase
MQFIDLKQQYQKIESNIDDAIKRVLNHGQYIMGPEVAQLEEKLAKYCGVKHAIVNSSGTDALLMALMALDVKPGDEIITTPFSFFATAEVISLLNAIPVFVDICPKTYNMDAKLLEKAITPKTRAIMPVSLYGQCADMDAINIIAGKHGLAVIEDAAQSFGASYKGRRSCGLSTIGATSFFPSKPLGAYGDAGACFTDDDNLAQNLREIRIHGQDKRYSHARIGINGRMDTIQAAVLMEKLAIFDEEVLLRQKVAQQYHDVLSAIVNPPHIADYNTSVFAQYTIEVDDRQAFQQVLKKHDIPTAVHYPIAMHEQSALSHLDFKKGDFPVAERAAKKVVSLPMHPYLEKESQLKIASAVKDAIESLVAA